MCRAGCRGSPRSEALQSIGVHQRFAKESHRMSSGNGELAASSVKGFISMSEKSRSWKTWGNRTMEIRLVVRSLIRKSSRALIAVREIDPGRPAECSVELHCWCWAQLQRHVRKILADYIKQIMAHCVRGANRVLDAG